MNFRAIRYVFGLVLRFEAAFMALPLAVAILYKEYRSAAIFTAVIIAMLAISFIIAFKKPANRSFYAKEGLVAVSLSWLIISVCGAVPLFAGGAVPTFIDALFETVSGFTTTGASVIPNVEIIDKSILFWRSFTHWIGGMGILVFITAILPMSGADPLHMMRAESPGPTTEKLVPKIRQSAAILYKIYVGMTIIEVIFLLAGGMPLFDSLVHTFGTAGTGGFSIKNASIGAYNSLYFEIVITVFMILFGVNFSAYFLLLAKKFKGFFAHEEVRTYIIVIIISILIISVNINGPIYRDYGESLRHSAFQVATMITTTGYATADYSTWPTLSKFLLIFLMFFGACAGSTGGGIKVSRFIIMFKTLKREAVRILHPQAVKLIKLDKITVQEEVIRGTGIFIVVYLGITAVSMLLISVDGYDMETTASAVAACINNIGPGLGVVSPVGNYSEFSFFSKIILIVDMLVGRLEVYPILLLISPVVWRRKHF